MKTKPKHNMILRAAKRKDGENNHIEVELTKTKPSQRITFDVDIAVAAAGAKLHFQGPHAQSHISHRVYYHKKLHELRFYFSEKIMGGNYILEFSCSDREGFLAQIKI